MSRVILAVLAIAAFCAILSYLEPANAAGIEPIVTNETMTRGYLHSNYTLCNRKWYKEEVTCACDCNYRNCKPVIKLKFER